LRGQRKLQGRKVAKASGRGLAGRQGPGAGAQGCRGRRGGGLANRQPAAGSPQPLARCPGPRTARLQVCDQFLLLTKIMAMLI